MIPQSRERAANGLGQQGKDLWSERALGSLFCLALVRTMRLPVATTGEDEAAALLTQGEDPQYVRLLESVANAYAEVESLTTLNPMAHARAQAAARQALDNLRQWVSAHKAS